MQKEGSTTEKSDPRCSFALCEDIWSTTNLSSLSPIASLFRVSGRKK